MSDSKRQEALNKQQEKREPEHPMPNNPFSSYMSNINHSPHQKQNARRRQRERSDSSHRSSRSKSRERRQRDRRHENPSYRQQQYDQRRSYQRKQYRDRGAAYLPKKQEQKDESYFKTKLCPLIQKVREGKMQGQCKKGSSCSFAHSEKEIRGLPNFRKTRLCIPFKNGECHKASTDCKYAHGQAEIKKLAYDYYPNKHHEFYKYDKFDKNDRVDRNDKRNDRSERSERSQRSQRYERNERSERDRYERSDRERGDRGYRDKPRDRDESRDRYKDYKDNYHPKDYSRSSHPSSSIPNPQIYPPGPYISSYNSAYMIPPTLGSFVQSGQLYAPSSTSHPGAASASNYGPASSSLASSSAQAQGQSYPSLYNMGPSYEYGFGYLPHNYPPFNSSSV